MTNKTSELTELQNSQQLPNLPQLLPAQIESIDAIYRNSSKALLEESIRTLKTVVEMREIALRAPKYITPAMLVRKLPIVCYHNFKANLNTLLNNSLISHRTYDHVNRIFYSLNCYNAGLLLVTAEYLKQKKAG